MLEPFAFSFLIEVTEKLFRIYKLMYHIWFLIRMLDISKVLISHYYYLLDGFSILTFSFGTTVGGCQKDEF